MAEDDDDDLSIVPGGNDLPAGVQIRLHKLATRVKQLRKENETKAQRIIDLQAEHTAELAERDSRLEEMTPLQERIAALEGEQTTWQTEKTIHGAGITTEQGIKATRLWWDSLDETERPEGGMAAWLGEDNRENLPKAITAYFGDDSAASTQRKHNPDNGVQRETRQSRSAAPAGSWSSIREQSLAETGIQPIDVGKLTGRSG